jgi:ribosomal protein L31E
MVDKLLTINLRNYLVKQSRRRRHMKISKYVRNRVSHYMKVDEENVKLTGDLNIVMIKKHALTMLPLKVNVKIENGIATVSPFATKKAQAPAATTATAKKAEAKPAAAPATAPKTEKKASEPKTAAKKEAKPAAATK